VLRASAANSLRCCVRAGPKWTGGRRLRPLWKGLSWALARSPVRAASRGRSWRRLAAVWGQDAHDNGTGPGAGLIAVTVPELLRLLRGTVIPPPRRDRAHRPYWSIWRRRHQHRAQASPSTLERLRRNRNMTTATHSRHISVCRVCAFHQDDPSGSSSRAAASGSPQRRHNPASARSPCRSSCQHRRES
jgi:hypothetical protein